MGIDFCHRLRALDDKFVEEGCRQGQRITGDTGYIFSGVMGFVITKLGYLAQTPAPQQGQINCCSQSHQTLVGTNIGGSAFALNMLLTRSQS